MNNVTEVTINGLNESGREEVIALLSELSYDAFEENENSLKAYIKEEHFDAEALRNVLNNYQVKYSTAIIEDQNWNQVWESNFQPVTIGSFCAVRADFHQAFPGFTHEIVITPKMSFGTGHHATTYMMIDQMSRLDFLGKSVADFGTGTGVLAILAEKMGSRHILAIDYDDWSIENTAENIEKNQCKKIELLKADTFHPTEKFDIILANINKNVILDNALSLTKALNPDGLLLLSGLLTTDEQDIVAAFLSDRLTLIHTVEKNNWICILLKAANKN